MFADVQAALYS